MLLHCLQSLTRIVAHGEEWLPKAVNVINLATQMMNGQFQGGQQQQQQAAVDAAAEEEQQQQRVLVFQPLKVRRFGMWLKSCSSTCWCGNC